jgi:hypothetical protein
MYADRVARLREQLVDMRATLIEQLAEQIDGGNLRHPISRPHPHSTPR